MHRCKCFVQLKVAILSTCSEGTRRGPSIGPSFAVQLRYGSRGRGGFVAGNLMPMGLKEFFF